MPQEELLLHCPRTWDTAPCNLGHALHPRAAAAPRGLTFGSELQVHSMGTCFSGLSSEAALHMPTLWTQHSGCSMYTSGTRTSITVVLGVSGPQSCHHPTPASVPLWQLGVHLCLSSVLLWTSQYPRSWSHCDSANTWISNLASQLLRRHLHIRCQCLHHHKSGNKLVLAKARNPLATPFMGERDEVVSYPQHLSWRVPKIFANTDHS